jgi:hypothetical protein
MLYAINTWPRAASHDWDISLSAFVVRSIIGVALFFVSGSLGGQMVHVKGQDNAVIRIMQ